MTTSLSKLVLSNKKKRSSKEDPVLRSRNKVIAGLERQIQIHLAELKNEVFSFEGKRWRSMDDGTRQKVSVQIIPKSWSWIEDDKVFLTMKAGLRSIELAEGKPTITVGPIKNLEPTLRMLIEIVGNGDADQQIAASRVKSK